MVTSKGFPKTTGNQLNGPDPATLSSRAHRRRNQELKKQELEKVTRIYMDFYYNGVAEEEEEEEELEEIE